MERIINYFKYVVSVIGTVFTYLFGSWDKALAILITFMVLDYITGLIKAWYKKELSSDVGLHGLARKATILIVLIIAVLLDRLINQGTWVFRTLVAYFYIANEGISILENIAVLNVPFPAKIKDVLIQLQENKGDGENVTNNKAN